MLSESSGIELPDEYPHAKTGRPAKLYKPQLAREILRRLAEGETLTAICRAPEMPNRRTVGEWVNRLPGFGRAYAHAREMQAEVWADEAIEFADGRTICPDQGPLDREDVMRSKLKVETRLRLIAVTAPHRHLARGTGEDSDDLTHNAELSDRERARRLATFLVEARGLIGFTAEEQSAESVSESDKPVSE